MKAGWQKKKLREICELINGRAYSQPELLNSGKYPVLRVGNFFTNKDWYYSDLELSQEKYCEKGDLLYAWSASFGPRIWTGEKVIYHYHIWKVQPNETVIDKKFLYMWFLWDADKIKKDHGTGTTMTHVGKGSMEERDIFVPPLPEQQRIVAILDEAFDAIAAAKVNAEKNLQNARVVLESFVRASFCNYGEDWIEKKIERCFKIKSGDFLPAKSMNASGEIKVYGGNGIIGNHDKHNLSGENIIVGRVGAKCGNVRYVKGNIWLTDNAFCISEYYQKFDLSFLERLLTFVQLRNTANQAAQPVISFTTIKDITLKFPQSIEKQKVIANNIDHLEELVVNLESIYQRKLAALDELKQSLLHQAFAGEL